MVRAAVVERRSMAKRRAREGRKNQRKHTRTCVHTLAFALNMTERLTCETLSPATRSCAFASKSENRARTRIVRSHVKTWRKSVTTGIRSDRQQERSCGYRRAVAPPPRATVFVVAFLFVWPPPVRPPRVRLHAGSSTARQCQCL